MTRDKGESMFIENLEVVTWTLTVNALIIVFAVMVMVYMLCNEVSVESPYIQGGQLVRMAMIFPTISLLLSAFCFFTEVFLEYGAFPVFGYVVFMLLSGMSLFLGVLAAYRLIYLHKKTH